MGYSAAMIAVSAPRCIDLRKSFAESFSTSQLEFGSNDSDDTTKTKRDVFRSIRLRYYVLTSVDRTVGTFRAWNGSHVVRLSICYSRLCTVCRSCSWRSWYRSGRPTRLYRS